MIFPFLNGVFMQSPFIFKTGLFKRAGAGVVIRERLGVYSNYVRIIENKRARLPYRIGMIPFPQYSSEI